MIERYAHDQVRSGRWPPAKSLAMAQAEFDRLLPQGLSTPSHHLYAIQCSSTRQNVGTLWVRISESGNDRTAFICDLQIDAAFRRMGHARQALVDLEEVLVKDGVSSLGLHAFSHNAEAISLYGKLGFQTTSVNMHKPLKRPCE